MKWIKSLCFILLFLPCFSGENLEIKTDVRVGYSFLSSEDSTFFRNHIDISEGALIENLMFSVKNIDKNSWFSNFSLEARTGDRFDTGRKLKFFIEKKGIWNLKINQRQDFDYFADSSYNYGASNRDKLRSNLQVDFNFSKFKHTNFYFGYSLNETTGNAFKPYSQWNDVFALNLNPNLTKEAVKVGINYNINKFNFSLNQNFTNIRNRNEVLNSPTINQINNLNTITLNPDTSKNVKTYIPSTVFNGSYSGDSWIISTSYSYQNGDINNDTIDLKSYFFNDFGSRNDFLTTYSGEADSPLETATLYVMYQINPSVSVGYDVYYRSLETKTSLVKNLSWIIYGTQNNPISTISQEENISSYYSHDLLKNKIYLKYNVNRFLNFTIKASNITENYYIGETESLSNKSDSDTNRIEVESKIRFNKGAITVNFFDESIDNPLFRTAGDKKYGGTLSTYLTINDKWSLNGLFSKISKEDNSTLNNYSNDSTLYDLSSSFVMSEKASLSFGYTRMELDISNLFFLADMENPIENDGRYLTKQNCWYLNGQYKTPSLICNSSVFYIDDTGSSLPLSNLMITLDCQYKITNSWFALVGAKYFDYTEDLNTIHNYNLNQITVGFRYVSK